MRAALVALAAAGLAAGCGAPADSSAPTTGLVVAVHYDPDHVHELMLRGATAMTGRKFGPYVLSDDQLPPGGTVGFVFDASDEGSVLVCGDARDDGGNVLASDCDQFDVRADLVSHGDLTLR